MRFEKLSLFKLFHSINESVLFKAGLLLSKKICFVLFKDSSSKMMKNIFIAFLKALFLVTIFRFLS